MNQPGELIDDLRLLEPEEPFHVNYWLIAGCIATVLLLWWMARHFRARSRPTASPDTIRKAQSDALAELERLFALIDREESRPYAIESSAIIRRYIENRFSLNAPRRSTEEFLVEAQMSPKLDAAYQDLLREFLRVCDLLKFARTFANRSELRELHEAAIRFVKETFAAEPAEVRK